MPYVYVPPEFQTPLKAPAGALPFKGLRVGLPKDVPSSSRVVVLKKGVDATRLVGASDAANGHSQSRPSSAMQRRVSSSPDSRSRGRKPGPGTFGTAQRDILRPLLRSMSAPGISMPTESCSKEMTNCRSGASKEKPAKESRLDGHTFAATFGSSKRETSPVRPGAESIPGPGMYHPNNEWSSGPACSMKGDKSGKGGLFDIEVLTASGGPGPAVATYTQFA
eukprot:gnl/MRDRNA2_/MRDRNA2_95729_c0_seq1.p1 gnl/MRDRNA2_/MRDRNA2_95729_c0~~gnl/MRDRNA2_/MRDRNA2_95729_c0_seq1.p1  ORF type:complete len:231 (-),score=28.93 gnl/MRDRNA2_/MRDRNA2_95729_c0_seq1:23-688(-)